MSAVLGIFWKDTREVKSLRRVLGVKTEKELALHNWFRDRGDETLRLAYPLTEDSVVIDAGGYEGAWAAQIVQRYDSKVVIFEPVHAFAQRIRDRFIDNPKAHIYELALGGEEGYAEIHIAKDGSSVYTGKGDTEPIHIVDASQFLQDMDIARIDLMKVNIEGGEYELLPNLIGSKYIQLIRELQIQFHDFVPRAVERAENIRRSLRQTHDLTWQYPFVWENWRLRSPTKTPAT